MWKRGNPERSSAHVPLRLLDLATRDQAVAAIRAACQVAPLSDDRAVCRVLGRYKVVVDLRDLGLTPHLMLDGFWELWIVEAMRRLVRPGMSCVDVGANLGCHTLLLADLVGSRGRVHAFEPNPTIAALLRHSVELNGFDDRVLIDERPVSDRAGLPVAFATSADQPKNARILGADGPCPPNGAVHALISTTLDECLADQPVDLVKIDVEGAEQDTWRGMAGILARGAPIQVILEFTVDRYPDPAAFLRALTAPDLRLSRIDPVRGIQPVTPDQVLAAPPCADQTLLLQR